MSVRAENKSAQKEEPLFYYRLANLLLQKV